MNILLDANALYAAGTAAIKGSRFKYGTQLFEMDQLLETAKLQKKLSDRTYRPVKAKKFRINERGHERYISSDIMTDKAATHCLCDEMITPAIRPYLIYDNSASQKKKGVGFHRKRLLYALQDYYRTYNTFSGWALIIDFSGYYPNMHHDIDAGILEELLRRSEKFSEEELELAAWMIGEIFKKMRLDVSRFSDEEIERMYREKIDPCMNLGVDPRLLTRTKWLKKGIDIGNQVSQASGIVHPYRIDNYCKIVRGVRFYRRYTDDILLFHPDKAFLRSVYAGIEKEAADLGLLINEKKTRLQPLTKPFRHLQVKYQMTEEGKVIRKISPKTITRQRRRLKAYKRLLDNGRMTYPDIENAFKSWLGSQYHYMSWQQIYNIGSLYYNLFNRRPKWKKGHSRLHWLMEHPSPTWSSTGTATSAPRK